MDILRRGRPRCLMPFLLLAAGACMLRNRMRRRHRRHMRHMRAKHEEQIQLLREIRDALRDRPGSTPSN